MIYRIVFFVLTVSHIAAQNSVSGTFIPAEDFSFAFIYKVTPEGANFVKRARLDEEGTFTVELNSGETPGMYKVVYAVPPEENNFDFIYSSREHVAFEFDLNKGISFSESEENKLWNSYLKSMRMVHQTISNYYQTNGTDPNAFADIFKTLAETQSAYESSAEGMLVLQLIKANRPYIPQGYQDLSSYSSSLKETYFDHIDFDSEFLQSSSFITDRMNGYMFGVSDTSSNQEYKTRVDEIAEVLSKFDKNSQLLIYKLLWEEFLQLKNDELTSYIASNYLLPLTNKEDDLALIQKVEGELRTSIGAKAPNFALNSEGKQLHDLDLAEKYLLVFWSSSCSHCMEEVPKVHQLLKDRKEIKVVAYGLEDVTDPWEIAIEDLPDFIHVYGAKKWDNPIVEAYHLSATPTYFLLDEDMTIIAKPYDYQALEGLIKAQ